MFSNLLFFSHQKCFSQHNSSKKVRKSLVLDPWEKEEVGAQLFTEENSLDVQVSPE